MKLVIVESPAKAKTIEKFLGKDYRVVASFGHIRDLPQGKAQAPASIKDKPWAALSIDVDNNFEPVYIIPPDSKKRVAELKKLLKDCDELILATDEDREGEAISWHLLEALEANKTKKPISRIAFHEITKSAIDEALSNPRPINDEMVQAQEGRRILDRLFGYRVSEVLWKKVAPKLSAGRVQSVAVRLVVEREEARRAFRKAVYWDIEAELEAEGKPFKASLVELGGKQLASGKDFDPDTGELKADKVHWLQAEQAQRVAEGLRENLPWTVAKVDQKEAKLRPYPPFITSTLQQAASSLLGFTPDRAMRVAQRLYEGEDLGNGDREGLITYMRTDSVTLSNRALGQAKDVITGAFGERYHQWRTYKGKTKNAQEAHEAIRPTDLRRTPDMVAKFVSDEAAKLYRIIWNRTIASQMADAELLKTTVDFAATADGLDATLRANGSVVTFEGFLKVADSAQQDTLLPEVKEGQRVVSADAVSSEPGALKLVKEEAVEHETKPPARYTEASLVKALEDEGIGRPSTYAPTIRTILDRGYVAKKGTSLMPTFLGIAVVRFLRENFPEHIDLQFTARMEDILDDIATGQRDHREFLHHFYFGEHKGNEDLGKGLVKVIDQAMEEGDFPRIPVGEDPDTGEPIVVRLGKAGSSPFIQRGEGGKGNTASLPDGIAYDELSVDKALELIAEQAKGPKVLGTDPETGKNIYLMTGPFGPYMQLGETDSESKKKPKRTGVPKDVDPESVDLDRALQYLALPRELGKHPDTGNKVKASIGPYGPYVVCNKEFRSLKPEAGDNVLTVDLDRAVHLLAQPKATRGSTKKVLKDLGKHPETGDTVEVVDGRYGAYVTDGNKNATLPKDGDPAAVTMEEAVQLLAKAKPKGKRKAKSKAKPKAKAKSKAKAKTKAKPKKKPEA